MCVCIYAHIPIHIWKVTYLNIKGDYYYCFLKVIIFG